MVVFSVSAIVDDIASNFPPCAQSCVKEVLLQICSQDQTAKCFCTTQPARTAVSLSQCIVLNALPICNSALVLYTARQLCLEAGYDSNGFKDINPTTIAIQTITEGISESTAAGLGPSPTSGGSTSVPKPAPTVDGSIGESESGSGDGSGNGSGNQGSSQGSKSSGLSTGVIIGITVSAVVALGIVALLIMFIVKHNRPAAPDPQPATAPLPPPDYHKQPELSPGHIAPPPPPQDYSPYDHRVSELPPPPPVAPQSQGYSSDKHPVPELPPEQLRYELGLTQERQELPAAAR